MISACIRCAFLTGVLLLGMAAAAQNKPQLKIESPRSGTIVHPGDTITVVVNSPSTQSVNVFVLGEGGLIGESPASRLPARIRVSIPANFSPGTYTLSALGKIEGGEELAASIEIDVELPDSSSHGASMAGAASIQKITGSRIILASQGEELPLEITATYSNGTEIDIKESLRLKLRTSDRNVAEVTQNRMVKAVGRGETTIIATYQDGEKSIQGVIPVIVEAEILSAAPAALVFGNDRAVPVGSSASQQIVLTYQTDNSTLRASNITVTGDFSQTNDCLSSEPRTQKMCTVTVTFAPTVPGKRMGTLEIRDNWTSIPTTVSLTGIAASARLAPRK